MYNLLLHIPLRPVLNLFKFQWYQELHFIHPLFYLQRHQICLIFYLISTIKWQPQTTFNLMKICNALLKLQIQENQRLNYMSKVETLIFCASSWNNSIFFKIKYFCLHIFYLLICPKRDLTYVHMCSFDA